MLAANGRINPLTYRQDPELCKWIDIVGIGIPEDVPQVKPVLRGVLPGIEENARIGLWGGGLWDWLDPLSLVRAWPLILAHYPDARLVFLGTRHPNPNVPQQKIVKEVISLSEQMGLRNRTVFFIDWLSYEDHASALVEADVGVSLHPIHIETRFSIRKRVLDYMWARLPVVVTEGDVVSEWINSYHLGRTVPPMDSVALSEALIAVLSRPKQAWYVGFDDLATQLHWKQVAEPPTGSAWKATRPMITLF